MTASDNGGIDGVLFVIFGVISVVIVLALIWGLIALAVWSFDSPLNNKDRCKAIAISRNAQSSITGWRADTCYIHKDGKEEVIKL